MPPSIFMNWHQPMIGEITSQPSRMGRLLFHLPLFSWRNRACNSSPKESRQTSCSANPEKCTSLSLTDRLAIDLPLYPLYGENGINLGSE